MTSSSAWEPGSALVRGLFDLAQRCVRAPRAVFALLALGWALLIFQLSASPPISSGTYDPARSWASNLAHAPEYGIFALFLVLALRSSHHEGPATSAGTRSDPLARASRLAFWIAVLYGVSDEVHQSFVPGRDASVCDLATDVAGAWLALEALRAALARDRSRFVSVVARGLLACAISALIATFAGPMFPAWTWL